LWQVVRLNSRLEGRALLEALVAMRDGAGRKAKARRDASQGVAICTGLFLYSPSISPLIHLLFSSYSPLVLALLFPQAFGRDWDSVLAHTGAEP
jgi:hypothetical protein